MHNINPIMGDEAFEQMAPKDAFRHARGQASDIAYEADIHVHLLGQTLERYKRATHLLFLERVRKLPQDRREKHVQRLARILSVEEKELWKVIRIDDEARS